jgi:hypothetical protein
MALSSNTVRPLQFAHVRDDPFDLDLGDTFNARHVAEGPVVRPHAIFCSTLKRCIAVMTWFVDFVNQWRAILRTGSALAMASGAVPVEQFLSFLGRFRESRSFDAILRLAVLAVIMVGWRGCPNQSGSGQNDRSNAENCISFHE